MVMIEEIVKIDDRGRVVIPTSARKILKLSPGTELVLRCDDEKNHILLEPFFGRDTEAIRIRVLMPDIQGAMAKIATIVGNMGINLLQNEARSVRKGATAEWISIADISKMPVPMTLDEIKQRILEDDAALEAEIEGY